jgi:hypothetical protein
MQISVGREMNIIFILVEAKMKGSMDKQRRGLAAPEHAQGA